MSLRVSFSLLHLHMLTFTNKFMMDHAVKVSVALNEQDIVAKYSKKGYNNTRKWVMEPGENVPNNKILLLQVYQ